MIAQARRKGNARPEWIEIALMRIACIYGVAVLQWQRNDKPSLSFVLGRR